ncbi:MAG: hypothetical protein WBF89_18475 [Steroidobacteraceae bacterium]
MTWNRASKSVVIPLDLNFPSWTSRPPGRKSTSLRMTVQSPGGPLNHWHLMSGSDQALNTPAGAAAQERVNVNMP